MKRLIDTRQSTLIGLFGGLVVLLASTLLAHLKVPALLNFPGLIMVVGGTLTATLVSRPIRDVLSVFKGLRRMLRDEPIEMEKEVRHLLNIAHWYRLGNLGAAEQEIALVGNPLLRTGAQLVLDQEPIHDIIKTLQWRITGVRAKEQGEANILRTMAGLAPAFGMLGTLFGLMQMLSGLAGAGLGQIGTSMSFALITTLYGLVLANMVFKPLAMKAERRIQHRVLAMNFILEGVILLHQRRHPMVINEALGMYLSQFENGESPDAFAKAA